jgi:hypothetical protein
VQKLKRPRVLASIVAVFLLVSALQAVSWLNRPPPEWHPAWWQSHIWADIGSLLMAPLVLLAAAVSVLLPGIAYSPFARGFVSGIGFAVYLVIVYAVVFRILQWIVAQFAYTPPKIDPRT